MIVLNTRFRMILEEFTTGHGERITITIVKFDRGRPFLEISRKTKQQGSQGRTERILLSADCLDRLKASANRAKHLLLEIQHQDRDIRNDSFSKHGI